MLALADRRQVAQTWALRDYQQRTLDMIDAWFAANAEGHPCAVLPTGSGKSWIIAAFCRNALTRWPETRILMATHVRELIEQNAEKMRAVWPGAPMGIYSAGMGRRELAEPITFGGIQSLRGKASRIGHVDLVLIDECHLVSHEQQGGYRTLIDELTVINPALRVIGFTATPYRLGHGYITDPPALFADLIEPVTVEELLAKGHLAPLRSKVTVARLDVTGVAHRGGEFVESALQAAVDTDEQNRAVVTEIIARGVGRRSWLVFCSGVRHAEHIAALLDEAGVVAKVVTGETPKAERAEILRRFKRGEIQALTNANVLTTGFDHPGVDLIAFLRPTESPGLYVQMAGRGMRPKDHCEDCLVLDFAGNVERHGPITRVNPPRRRDEDGDGEAPTKTCPECGEINHASVRVCEACGSEFPPPAPKELRLRDDDIMGRDTTHEMQVQSWTWRVHESRTSGKLMLRASYLGAGLTDPIVDEYFALAHEGEAQRIAWQKFSKLAGQAHVALEKPMQHATLGELAEAMQCAAAPRAVEYARDGKYFRITRRIYDATT